MPKIKYQNIDERDDKKWSRSLIWCPTQIYKTVYVDFICLDLYLRWRWEDPFTGYITLNQNSEIVTNKKTISEKCLEENLSLGYFLCLFQKHKLYYKSDQYRSAEKKLEEIWYLIEKPRIHKIIKEHPELLL